MGGPRVTGVEVVDATGATLLPNLIDAHTHTDAAMLGGFNWSSQPLMWEVVDDGNGGLEQEDQRCAGGCASAVARGSGAAARDALAWTA